MARRPTNSRVQHGTPTCYSYGCRQPECKQAAAQAGVVRRRANKQRMEQGLVTPEHGKTSTYTNYGCRCTACTASMTDYYRDLRHRRRGKTGLS